MLKLDRNYVLEPFFEEMYECQCNIHTGLDTVEQLAALSGAQIAESKWPFTVSFKADGRTLNREKAETLYLQWILLNAFGDIYKSLRTAFERLYVVKTAQTELVSTPNLSITERVKQLRRKASRFGSKDLFKKTGVKLKFLPYLESFNCARNCLEHTNGIVTTEHCNNSTKDKLVVYGVRFRTFAKVGEIETLLQPNDPTPLDAEIWPKSEQTKIEFSLNQRIELSLDDFDYILTGCLGIGLDIAIQIPDQNSDAWPPGPNFASA